MTRTTADRRAWEDRPLYYSVARSLVTPHVVFTAVILSVVTWGVALAPEPNWSHAGLLYVAAYLGVEGMHDVDLADPDVAVTIDPRVQRTVGYGLIAAGTLVGLSLAWLTTWGLLAFVALEVGAGLAYNAEWFDGRFHDLDRLGWATAAVALGVAPVTAGYFVQTGTITLPVLLWAAVAATYSVGILHLYQVAKVPALYDRMGIEHVREPERSEEEAYRLVTTGLQCVIGATILAGLAFAVVAISA